MGSSRAIGLAAFTLVLFALAGCGDNLAEVTGTVKYNGELVKEGAIRFDAVDNSSPSKGGLITNGAYSVKIPPGEMKVSFTGTKVIGSKKLYENDPNSPEVPTKVNLLPDKYKDDQTAERFSVQRGVNKKDWELTGP